MEQAVVDDIINRLLEVRGRPGKQVQLSESEIKQLCAASREIFLQQPNLLELEAPIKICGKLNLVFGYEICASNLGSHGVFFAFWVRYDLSDFFMLFGDSGKLV
ncbi:hypothetical protein Ahy_B09g096769 isoform E [Arachis hypogaea]|uniref:protein-serine/threonine phosphatase n=1 Tax=Arachis hypogaea TaxID=3818 RepID=A0A444XM69_ARAHY|nr:hypothetical protein Ahy_B09g096769 isoform E [Arachis hypogaea]